MAIEIPCPHCGERKTEIARNTWYIQGFFLFSRFGSTRYVGCVPCTRSRVWKSLGATALTGWWCLPWGIATPVVIAQNFVAALASPNRGDLERTLKRHGIAMEEVELDWSGRAPGEIRLVAAVLGVLHRVVWADGDADPREIAKGIEAARRMLGDLALEDEVRGILRDPEPPDHELTALPADARLIALRAAITIAEADEVIDPGEVEAVRQLGAELDVDPKVVESMVVGLMADHQVRQEVDGLKAVAAEILGLDRTLRPTEIRDRYRALLLEADDEEHSDRLTWAYHTLIG